jgi:hypothetical protein
MQEKRADHSTNCFNTLRWSASGDYNFVLVWNPYKVIQKQCDDGVIPMGTSYNALLERAMEIGAAEDLMD